MSKKTATKSRSRINPSRRAKPHQVTKPSPVAAAKVTDLKAGEGITFSREAKQEWQVISVSAPPGIYAGVDYDGNGLIFRRVDTHHGMGLISTHLESLTGERIAASSIAQYHGPLPEFGDNPEFGMFVKVAVPVTKE